MSIKSIKNIAYFIFILNLPLAKIGLEINLKVSDGKINWPSLDRI